MSTWEHPNRERNRATFGSAAELYDRARPTYPADVFDDLTELSGLRPGARVLEIGPGTGKATVELVRRGYDVTGVELSPELADVARRNAPAARIEVAEFEEWDAAGRKFDMVVAFSAFHWIAPAVRCVKPAALLRPGGALGVVGAPHVGVPEDDPFWVEVQEDYDAVVPHPDNGPPLSPDEIHGRHEEFRGSGLFASVEERRHLEALEYDADSYVELLGTFSDNLALPAAQREELFRRIHARIAARPGGTVTKHQLVTVTVGRT